MCLHSSPSPLKRVSLGWVPSSKLPDAIEGLHPTATHWHAKNFQLCTPSFCTLPCPWWDAVCGRCVTCAPHPSTLCIHSCADEELVTIEKLPDWARPAFRGMKSLNRVQSKVSDTALYTGENMLVCAPTGMQRCARTQRWRYSGDSQYSVIQPGPTLGPTNLPCYATTLFAHSMNQTADHGQQLSTQHC